MIVHCEKCKKKLNTMWDTLLELTDNKYLCTQCGEPIDQLLYNLSHIHPQTYSKDDFDGETKKILSICENNYDASVTISVKKTIDNISEKMIFLEQEIPNRKTDDSVSKFNQLPNIAITNTSTRKIGEKIISTTQIIIWINIILTVIGGFVYLFINPIVAVIVLIFGLLFYWIIGLFLQGFGELIKNSEEIVELLRKNK